MGVRWGQRLPKVDLAQKDIGPVIGRIHCLPLREAVNIKMFIKSWAYAHTNLPIRARWYCKADVAQWATKRMQPSDEGFFVSKRRRRFKDKLRGDS